MKNINYMMSYVESYLKGGITRLDFSLDFSHELIKRYPKMKREHREYAELIYDYLSVDGVDVGDAMTDAEFKRLIRRQFNEVRDITASGFC